MNKSNLSSLIGIAAVGVVWAGLSIAAMVKSPDDFSVSERAKLSQFPEITYESVFSGKFMKEFEEYSLDQFPFRDKFRELKANGAFYIFNKKDNNGIYVHDGYAIKLESKLDEKSVSSAADKFNWLHQNILKDRTSNVYLSVIPDKNYFAAQQNGYPSMDYNKMVEILRNSMDYAEYIDIFGTLELSDYYKTDTHWRQEEIIETVNTLLLGMGQNKFPQKYEVKTADVQFYGVYYGQSALPLASEQIKYISTPALDSLNVTIMDGTAKPPQYTGFIDEKKLSAYDPYEMFLSGSAPIAILENTQNTSGKELVVFRDSFGSSISPLFAESYSKVTVIDTRYVNPDSVKMMADFGQIKITDSTDVIFLYSSLILNQSQSLQSSGMFTNAQN